MTTERGRVFAVLFVISLGINLFLGGVIAARWIAEPPASPDMRPLSVGSLRGALGPGANGMVDDVMAGRRGEIRARMQEAAQARDRAQQALSAEPFDPQKARQELANFRHKSALAQQSMQEAIVELAAKLTPQQRKRLHWVLQGPGAGRGRGPRYHGGAGNRPIPGP